MTSAWNLQIPAGVTGDAPASSPSPRAAPPPIFAPPRPPAPSQPNAALLTLFLSLVGFLGVMLLLYEFKFHGVTGSLHGVPTRILFVLCLALACSPYVLTIFRRVPFLFLLLPTVLVFFLYPLFSPFGLPFSRDPIYNFQFAQAILSSGGWSPTAGVTGQAIVYSYYPGGAIFNAEVSTLTNLPLLSTFNWGYELFRLLVLPLAIYALAVRLFGSRAAPLAVLFYMATPSIENNIPTQQDFAVTFFILSVVVLTYVASTEYSSVFLRLTLLALAAMVIMSHHVSTYILVGWLLGLTLLPWILKGRDPFARLRTAAVFVGTVAVAAIWIFVVTLPVITGQIAILTTNVEAIFGPSTKIQRASRLGGITFPVYQEVWIVAAVGLVVLMAVLTLAETYRRDEDAFTAFSILTGFLIVVLAIPFLSTGFSFLALRDFEFAGVILAPAAAWWLVHRFVYRPAARANSPGSIANEGIYPRRANRRRTRVLNRTTAAVLAIALTVVIFTGGSMVALSTRDQFSPPGASLIDSPTHIDPETIEAVTWADAHLNQSKSIWGDYLVYDTFGGFGHFPIHFNSYNVFQPTTLCNFGTLTFEGQYIVTDVYLNGTYPPPVFPGTAGDQPNGTYLPDYVDIAKFSANPQYFATLYQNSIFTVYVIVAEPPVTACPPNPPT